MLARNDADRQWYVLQAAPQMERKAAADLAGHGYKVYFPEVPEWVRRGVRRRKIEVRKPMFRGYLFVRLGLGDDFRDVCTTVGVHRFLKADENHYAVVPDVIMQRVCAIEQELQKRKEISGPSAIFAPGEKIRIDDGPFCGMTAEIENLDDAERVTILLTILGRESRTQIRADQLEKL